ncbi:MAG: enoyl-CoA hydratase/isomerase family protein [Gammaproteobacteria bacterium]|nr:enoyl-CoA hydratase/isomerase family protein [Gammaproteobacteria bacterium]MBV9698219.1 enoyl-CoA hydratase/isomerase family protein [Gammaproteobacteria bacterium]
MSDEILSTRAGAVCELRLNRPAKRNAITFAMYASLAAALRAAQQDEGVRAVLLSGEGSSFSAGNDLNDFLHGPAFDASHPVLAFLRTLATFEKPLVAAVQGRTVGIGVTLLLHCDLVLAARGTQFSLPFVKLGLVPEAASSLLLPRLAGMHRAAELLLLGEPCDASEALSMGLVNRVVEEDQLLESARALAATLASQPAGALRATRRLLRGDPAEVLARIEAEAQVFGALLKSEEFRSAVSAALAGKARA